MDPKVLVGKPVIVATRLSVQYIPGLLASGVREEGTLSEYRDLSKDDIQACLLSAAEALEGCPFMPLGAEPA